MCEDMQQRGDLPFQRYPPLSVSTLSFSIFLGIIITFPHVAVCFVFLMITAFPVTVDAWFFLTITVSDF